METMGKTLPCLFFSPPSPLQIPQRIYEISASSRSISTDTCIPNSPFSQGSMDIQPSRQEVGL